MSSLAVIWHYWIGVALFIPAVLLIVGIGIGYLVTVVMPRYPRKPIEGA
jgi:hypothetical protein